MTAAHWFVGTLAAYAALGLAFAATFVSLGVQKVDPVAQHAPLGFRLIILPGAAAIWPLLLARWIHARTE